MTALSNAEAIAEILAAFEDEDDILAVDRAAEQVAAILATLDNVAEAVVVESTTGSAYIDVVLAEADEDGDERCVTVRVSNHARKPNGHARPEWSFECGDRVAQHQLGLNKIAAL